MRGSCAALIAAACFAAVAAAMCFPRPAAKEMFGSARPYRVYPLERLLSPSECASLVEAARPALARSKVVNRDPSGSSDKEIIDGARTSSQAWLTEGHPTAGPAVAKLLDTAAALTGVRDGGLLESVMVARYLPGERYDAHHDSCTEGCDRAPVYRRATLLAYLNDGFEGGGTSFPEIGYRTSPKTGSGVLFYNTDPETGAVIRESLHAGDPVAAGEKFIATVWVKFTPELHGFGAAPGGSRGK